MKINNRGLLMAMSFFVFGCGSPTKSNDSQVSSKSASGDVKQRVIQITELTKNGGLLHDWRSTRSKASGPGTGFVADYHTEILKELGGKWNIVDPQTGRVFKLKGKEGHFLNLFGEKGIGDQNIQLEIAQQPSIDFDPKVYGVGSTTKTTDKKFLSSVPISNSKGALFLYVYSMARMIRDLAPTFLDAGSIEDQPKPVTRTLGDMFPSKNSEYSASTQQLFATACGDKFGDQGKVLFFKFKLEVPGCISLYKPNPKIPAQDGLSKFIKMRLVYKSGAIGSSVSSSQVFTKEYYFTPVLK